MGIAPYERSTEVLPQTAGGAEPLPYGRATGVRAYNVSPSVTALPWHRGDVGIAPYGTFIGAFRALLGRVTYSF